MQDTTKFYNLLVKIPFAPVRMSIMAYELQSMAEEWELEEAEYAFKTWVYNNATEHMTLPLRISAANDTWDRVSRGIWKPRDVLKCKACGAKKSLVLVREGDTLRGETSLVRLLACGHHS